MLNRISNCSLGLDLTTFIFRVVWRRRNYCWDGRAAVVEGANFATCRVHEW